MPLQCVQNIILRITGVTEATEAFKVWKAVKANKEQVEKEKQDRKPAPFKYVKVNTWVHIFWLFLGMI